jgi:hypothetical protein
MKKIIILALIICSVTFSPVFAATSDTLSVPSGLTLSATSSTISATWTANTDSVTQGYYITYYATGNTTLTTTVTYPNPSTTAATYTYVITGLDSNTEYRVELSAYDGSDESSYVYDTITTSTVDLDIKQTAVETVRIALSDTSSFTSWDLYIGTSPVSADSSGNFTYSDYNIINVTDIDADTAYTVTSLPNGTYYARVKAYNGTSEYTSDEVTFIIDDFGTLLSSSKDDNGCFIDSASHGQSLVHPAVWIVIGLTLAAFLPRRFLKTGIATLTLFLMLSTPGYSDHTAPQTDESVVSFNNLLGIKAGYFIPSEKLQRDVYKTIVPTSLYYERMLGFYGLSADISAGYAHAKGYAVTKSSSDQTGVEAKLDFIPVSMSLNANLELSDFITCYAGFGGDYWMMKEKSYYGESKHRVGGWHVKTGLKLFTEDLEYIKQWGVLIDAAYSSIDKFGSNDIDLGGWSFSAGLMYCF